MAGTQQPSPGHTNPEQYTIGFSDATLRAMNSRTLASCASFFIPYLRPLMSVLDCGCGAGSMTVELAQYVMPGEVVGLDVESRPLEQARTLAAARTVVNVRFEQGDVYRLPYADATFDAVFSHALISHLGDPARALAEMRRVLKSGGVAAVVENDTGTLVSSPPGSAMERYNDLFTRVQRHNGGGQLAARHLRSAVLVAGFTSAEAHAGGEAFGTPERARMFAANTAATASSANFVRTVVDEGWASKAEVAELPRRLLEWGERPDAFFGVLKCGVVAWVGPPHSR
jgi:SAM-dependent methyltransferase